MKRKATSPFLGFHLAKYLSICLFTLAILGMGTLAHAQFLCSEIDTTKNNQVEVYYLGPNSNLYEIVPGSNSYVQKTGLAGQGPSVAAGTGVACYVNTIYNGNEVFYVANVNGSLHIEQLWASNSSPTDLTVAAGGKAVAPGTNLVGFIDPTADTDNVFYIGTDQFVHVLTWSPSPGWQESSALDGTSVPAAATGSALSGHYRSLNPDQSQEVFYLGANQNVYELWRWSNTSSSATPHYDGWHSTDVTTANSSKPLAVSGSPLAGFYDSVASDDAMFYLGTNQHVYKLSFPSSAIWSYIDVTASAGALNAIAGSQLAAHMNTNNGQSEEVYFLDSSLDTRELWSWTSSLTSWNFNGYNGAPAAANGSPLATDMNNTTDEVYYIGDNDHIYELFSERDITAAANAPNAVP